MIISIDQKKKKQSPKPFHGKTTQQTRNRIEFPQSDQGHL